MAASLSVVIPTHQRAEILQECLARLARQTIARDLEVIVVSDGYDLHTSAMIKKLRGEEATNKKAHEEITIKDDHGFMAAPVTPELIHWYRDHVKFFEIEKSQQGVARNRGVKEATAPITLFIGDDAFLAPDACALHLSAHVKHKKEIAVLGFTTWDTELNITPTMRWLEETGWQFGYTMLTQYQHKFVPQDIQHRFTYTINLSLPTSVAQAHPFREDVTLYGWEDILWGQELRDSGIPLWYESNAVVLHHHMITLDDSLARIETLGKSLLHLTKIAPELDRKPTGLKLFAYKLIALTPTMRGKHYRAFLRGLSKN